MTLLIRSLFSPAAVRSHELRPRMILIVIIVLLRACHFHTTELLEGIRPTSFAVKKVYTPLLPVRSCPIP
jgi:hypothetical protein